MSPRRRRALVGLVVVLVLLALAGVLRQRLETAGAVPQDRPGTVLLVPGYGGDTGSLEALAAGLRAHGRTAVVVPSVGDGTGDLRAQAENVRRAADDALTAGAPSVDVVGYSAGGVVARIWAAELGGAGQARRVVTLGSPHHGTDLAALGAVTGACPTACRQLAPGSDLLASLSEAPAGPRWVSLWTAQDETVTPPGSASLEGALDVEVQSVCADARVSHGGLPRDPLVAGLVDRALAVAPLTAAPPASACATVRSEGAVLLSS